MRGSVPEEILNRRDKIGFATPERRWLRDRHDWVLSLLDGDTAAAIPAIDATAMKRDWMRFYRGKGRFSFKYWRWVNLIRWAEQRSIVFD